MSQQVTTTGDAQEAPAAAGATGAVSVTGLTKQYGDLEAVRGVDFDVQVGETFGFLGPNGAGKSTTISMLCTLVKPTAGSARVAGHDVVGERDEVRRNIGLVFQDTTLDGYLTADRTCACMPSFTGCPGNWSSKRMQQVMEMVGLWDRRAVLSTSSRAG